jgi:hypothetical protein
VTPFLGSPIGLAVTRAFGDLEVKEKALGESERQRESGERSREERENARSRTERDGRTEKEKGIARETPMLMCTYSL